jgi:hypothetical protein
MTMSREEVDAFKRYIELLAAINSEKKNEDV